MASVASTTTSEIPRIILIPWDASSPAHVDRLYQHRIGCGWGEDFVPGIKAAHESAGLNMYWIVLDPTHHLTGSYIQAHLTTFPNDAPLLQNTATTNTHEFQPRSSHSPSTSTSTSASAPLTTFLPIGHIGLGRVSAAMQAYNNDNDHDSNPSTRTYWLSNFYISRALQGRGLGRVTMEVIEAMARAAPWSGEAMALNAISGDEEPVEREAKARALGIEVPLFTNREMYERRGYVIYNRVEKLFSRVDETGKKWYWDALFMRKKL